jgi:hypothetical protein
MIERMAHTSRTLALALAVVASASIVTPVHAQSGAGSALLDALGRVPPTEATLASPISYVDYRAIEATRPGALAPGSLGELLEREEAGDPAADLWFAASMGIASGPSDLLAGLLTDGPSWPEVVGFDFFDIDRAVTFGTPPAAGTVLLGTFDPAAIGAAYAARGYTSTTTGELSLLCPEAGCDTGLEVDLPNRDPRNPFGGRLGRSEPLAMAPNELLSTADAGTMDAMLAVAEGSATSLADHGPFRAVATAPSEDVAILQATFLPGTLLGSGPDVASMIGASPDEVEALLAEFEALAQLTAPAAVAIIDAATPTEQVVTIALAYPDEAEATRAADAVAERLGSVRSLTRDVALADLLDQRGVTSMTWAALPPAPGASAVGKVELRAPLVGEDATDSNRPVPSSALYRLLVDLINTRDLLWLTPNAAPA